ncbi:Phosphoribosylglycinamide formyltransferase [Fundidesulfovibrio magnetotacticus]|uniref:Phosphoribosylglycinamide formyltransferase n=1 Tax=Fundidesulfovibrio magnetotacticus TaxID=2730080 RepID=A0A6V8LQ07_9BACT|nr:phosphoribosylglycinamide formyltransferase [Fundidesulfovibrio magnetotacticus]GFK93814.1 Phosphoribosylglycinamide formyltransferase [Fundidesulfovibrio magnetotacticus]
MTLPVAVLVSGSGSNLQALIDRIEAGVLDAEIRLVASNKPEAFGLERARRHGIATLGLPHKEFPDREAFDQAMVRAIRESGAQAVVLAGFMRLLTSGFLQAFPGRVLNIHPALLPAFPGAHGQRDAAHHGVKLAGCTVHFVDELMDHGPVIVQAAVPAWTDDTPETLGGRILALEHRVLPQAVQWLAQDRLRLDGRKVRLLPGRAASATPPSDALVNPPLESGF